MRNHTPKVTVRMSAYNHEKYVEQAILSIVNQTFQDFELIVIDDGSQDSTPEILERLSQKYGFYYERQENMGLTPTLNKLNRMANGEYLTGCASDDYWPLTRLEEQVEVLDSNSEVALVHGVPDLIDGEGNILKDYRCEFEDMLDGALAYYDLIYLRKNFNTTTHMMRKFVYDALGGYDESISVEDIDWMLRVTRDYEVKAVDKVWTYYRRHDSNWTITKAGASKLIRSECQLARKLGLRDGYGFLQVRACRWINICRRSGSWKQYIYLSFIVIYFWQRAYRQEFVRVLFGKYLAERIFKIWGLRYRRGGIK